MLSHPLPLILNFPIPPNIMGVFHVSGMGGLIVGERGLLSAFSVSEEMSGVMVPSRNQVFRFWACTGRVTSEVELSWPVECAGPHKGNCTRAAQQVQRRLYDRPEIVDGLMAANRRGTREFSQTLLQRGHITFLWLGRDTGFLASHGFSGSCACLSMLLDASVT